MTITASEQAALEAAACQVRDNAYAPYSGFRVGAAVLAGSGSVYTGANVENAAFNPTICAERAAIFAAISAGERELRAVAVCTETGVTPCGPCRQVMREFARDLPVYICDTAGSSRETSLSALLPDSFGPEDLPA